MYWMLSGKTNLQSVDNERYPMVKPVTVKNFLQQHSKETVGKAYIEM
jgi:hypothetical protein